MGSLHIGAEVNQFSAKLGVAKKVWLSIDMRLDPDMLMKAYSQA
jgi:hypothetical protein